MIAAAATSMGRHHKHGARPSEPEARDMTAGAVTPIARVEDRTTGPKALNSARGSSSRPATAKCNLPLLLHHARCGDQNRRSSASTKRSKNPARRKTWPWWQPEARRHNRPMQAQGTGPTIWLIPNRCNIALRTTTDSQLTISGLRRGAVHPAAPRPRADGLGCRCKQPIRVSFCRSLCFLPPEWSAWGCRHIGIGNQHSDRARLRCWRPDRLGCQRHGRSAIGRRTACWFERDMATVKREISSFEFLAVTTEVAKQMSICFMLVLQSR